MLWSLLAALAAHAETADEIVARARAANRVDSSIQDLRMTISPKGGGERIRSLTVQSRRDAGTTRTLLNVTSPSDIAGVRILMIDHPTGADETMFYLPTTKRVTRVSSTNQHSKFIDSNLTMEDLRLRESADGAHTLVAGLETPEVWVIDTAMSSESSYSKVRATIAKTDLVVKKLELFEGDALVKTIEVVRTERSGSVVLPTETVVTDVKRGSTTKLEIVKHQLDIDRSVLPDSTFERENLER